LGVWREAEFTGLLGFSLTSSTPFCLFFCDSPRWKNTPAPPGMAYCPTTLEHVANCATHLPWIPVSMFGLQRLYSKSTNHIELSSAIIYGMAVVCLFLTSSAFHVCSFLSHNSRIRVILHKCDRVVIYIFIAASYTP
ncbi:hypothetical protein T265_14901, partial [Opisthorchis viverrini]